MNIADPNLLEIIAKHIDDKSTFNNFAKSSKKCSHIVRKLTEVKKFEFKHINFVNSKLACIWNGCYTKGFVTRGSTNVWFYACGLEIIYDNEIDIKDYNENFEIYDYHVQDLYGNHSLGYFCQMNEDYIEHIINGLKKKRLDIFEFGSKKDLKKFNYGGKLDKCLEKIKDEKLIFYDIDMEISSVWIVRNLEAVIEELEKVSEYCRQNKISYH